MIKTIIITYFLDDNELIHIPPHSSSVDYNIIPPFKSIETKSILHNLKNKYRFNNYVSRNAKEKKRYRFDF